MTATETLNCDFGAKAHNFSLKGTDGNTYNLQNLMGKNGLLVMFICNHCPYVKAIIHRIIRDTKELKDLGVNSVAIMSNDVVDYEEDSFENMQKIANDLDFQFPYLIDETQEIAKAYEAVCTPDFFGYSANFELQYRGRLDESRKEAVKDARRDLFLAMEQVALVGIGPKEQIPSMGCSIKWKKIGCDSSNKLIPSNEALDFLLTQAKATKKTQCVELDEALNKVLANDILSKIDVPGFDNSAMDGYAINFDSQQKPPYLFKIVDRIIAGSVGNNLPNNCSARIFTGAPIPTGANTVIPQENCKVVGDSIEVCTSIQYGDNIRQKANDIAKNSIILKQGKTLTPADIGLVSSVGVSTIRVFSPITVGVFFSGNEIVEPTEVLKEGQIYNSNRYGLVALLNQINVKIINLGNIIDDFDETCKALTKLSLECDIIITTGGVSVGEEDHVKPAVDKLGEISMWNVKMKPGKPLAYGTINNCHFIGLPGNPVSAIATFLLFIKPFIKKIQGISNHLNHKFSVQVDYNWSSQFRREFVRVQLDYSTIPPTANKYYKQGSDVLSSLSWADGMAEMTDEKSFRIGDIVNFYPL